MKKLFLSLAVLITAINVSADEGMWLLKELNRQSLAKMKQLGFKFPENKIYNEQNPSLKDAVVIFGKGCTGVAVSDKGLIFTNHHCGFSDIQKLSSVEHDYLKNGFISQSFGDELKAEGLQVSFLQKSEDVTDFVMTDVKPEDDENTRNNKINAKIIEYLRPYENDESISASVIPFYSQNKYYAVIYEIFSDVRLVFTPPQSIGKFGDETDNWMWPRHTGDFSVFRVYANKDNKPAKYDVSNVPYKPKYHVPVSLNGYKDGDYAMTIGYPGRTQRYMPSWGIKQMVESTHKPRIEVRGAKQAIWREAMNADDAVRIKYASKYASSSNYWKNAIGMNESIVKLGIIPQKEALESKFDSWVNSGDAVRKATYGDVLSSLKEGYTNSMEAVKIRTYLIETFFSGIEITSIASSASSMMQQDKDKAAEKVKKRLSETFKDYLPELDRQVMPVLMELYAKNVPAEYLPSIYDTIQVRFGGDYQKYADWLYNNTKLTTLEGTVEYVSTENAPIDPAIEFSNSLRSCLTRVYIATNAEMMKIAKGNRLFMAGLIEMEPNKTFYPDANFTQRLSYGSIGGYKPADAIEYNYYTTPKGILEKYKPNDPEFDVQPYILDHLTSADWGQYVDRDGSMHVDFLSNNDITGGNSGSPVFDKNANLIGLAFDGNWESLSGDITFNPDVQRCINVDIRYVLYVIDKVMKCPRLIEELTISK